VATLAIARVLGAEGLGIYALGISLVVWLDIPHSGFREALAKRVSEGREGEQYLTAGVVASLSSIVVPVLFVFFFRSYVNEYVGSDVSLLIIVILFANGLFGTFRFALNGQKKVAHAGWIQFLNQVLRTVIQIGLLLLGYAVFGLFIGYAVAAVLAALMALVFLDVRVSVPTKRHFRDLYAYAKHGWSTGFKGNTFNWMDTVILGFFMSSSLVGIYEVAWSVASFLVLVSNSVSQTLFPEISDISTEGDTDRIHHYLNEGLVFTGVFLIPGLFGAVAIGVDVLRIYNTEFTRGASVLVILIVARTLDAYATQFTSVLKAIDRPDVVLRIDLLFVGTNTVLNVALVYFYGWYGAAVATLLSGVVSLLVGYYSLTNLIGVPNIPVGEISKEIFAGAVMFVTVTIVHRFSRSEVYLTLIVVAVGAAIYVTVLLSISPRIRNKATALLGEQLGLRS
jgi:O-antigen/teichoic acid export membrane protein